MKTLRTISFASMLLLATPVLAQAGHEHHGGAVAEAPAKDADEPATAAPATAAAAKAGGGKMSHGGGMDGCKHMKGGGAADTTALERRIDELEKRLDLVQLLLKRESR